jgi:putative acetyltransferase
VVSLVAEREREVIGHVLFSRMHVTGDGNAWRALGLGPVAVMPGHQHRGLGSELILGGLSIARLTGDEIVFVLGDPAYYSRFGFSAEAAAPFASPYAGSFLMAQSFGRPLPARGKADYAAPFTALGGEGD